MFTKFFAFLKKFFTPSQNQLNTNGTPVHPELIPTELPKAEVKQDYLARPKLTPTPVTSLQGKTVEKHTVRSVRQETAVHTAPRRAVRDRVVVRDESNSSIRASTRNC